MTIFRYPIEEDVGGLFFPLKSPLLSVCKNMERLSELILLNNKPVKLV